MATLEEKWERHALRLNEELIKSLKQRGTLTDHRIESALKRMPRHHFLEAFYSAYGSFDLTKDKDIEYALRVAYADEALMLEKVGTLASISQPSIVVEMLEALELEESQKVLEIGAGSGWNAALIACIVGTSGQVVTIEVDEELAEKARQRIVAHGLAEVVTVVHGDGRKGAPEFSPFQRIICTAGSEHLYYSWLSQLGLGGIIVLPTDETHDYCPLLKVKKGERFLDVKILTLARFVPVVPAKGTPKEEPGIPVRKLVYAAEHTGGKFNLRES